VAVKRFDRDKHLPEIEAESYLLDVEAQRNLVHPNILRMLDSGKDDSWQTIRRTRMDTV
jgi:hypothetical protein